MKAKLIEIRDEGTLIVACIIDVVPDNEAERYLLGRTGYVPHRFARRFVWLSSNISGHPMELTYDLADWGKKYGNRTYQTVHRWLRETPWEDIESGQVVDVEYLLGETKEAKQSERLTNPAVDSEP